MIMGEYKYGTYIVIRHLRATNLEIYDCVPSSWVISEYMKDDRRVTLVRYPIESLTDTIARVIKCEPKNDKWQQRLPCKVIFDTDNLEEAMLLRIKKNKDRKQPQAYSKLTPDIEKCVIDIIKHMKATDQKNNEPNKRKQADLENTPQSKRQKVEDEITGDNETLVSNIDQRTIGDNNQNSEVSSTSRPSQKKHEEEIAQIYKTTAITSLNEKYADISLNKILSGESNHILAEYNETFQCAMSLLGDTADLLQQIITKHKNNESNTTQQRDNYKIDTRSDSEWTLKHPEPGPGLEELLPSSGIYVSTQGLRECKRLNDDEYKFARGLLEEVFTYEALTECSFTGSKPTRSHNDGSIKTKPGLDLNGRQTLVAYVVKYATEMNWQHDTAAIINSLKGKLYTMHKLKENQ